MTRDNVDFSMVVKHKSNSFGEGSPAFVRVTFDPYIGYIVGQNYVKTNYTGSNMDGGHVSVVLRDERNRHGSFLDIVV